VSSFKDLKQLIKTKKTRQKKERTKERLPGGQYTYNVSLTSSSSNRPTAERNSPQTSLFFFFFFAQK